MNRNIIAVALTTTLSCWSGVEPTEHPAPIVVDVAPRDAVALDAELTLTFSAPIGAADARACAISVVRADGRDVPTTCALDADGAHLRVSPLDTWPSDEQLRILLLDALRGPDGRRVEVGETPLSFTTARPDVTRTIVVEGPEPGDRAPANLRRVVASLRGHDAVESLLLVASGRAIRLPVVDRDDRGRVLLELPLSAPPLDPDTLYQVEADTSAIGEPALASSVRTGTVADVHAPELRLREVDRGGGTVRVVVEADEPIFASGRAIAPDGTWIALRAPLIPATRVELQATRRLASATRYALRLDARDYADLAAALLEVAFVTPDDVRVRLTELVPTPLHDWNDAGPGTSFDALPGAGAVTDSDEWLELVNASARPVDLTQVRLTLRIVDGSPSEHDVLAAAALRFGRGGEPTAWGVGEALVVRPRGSMAQRDLRVEVRWGDVVLDRVALARHADADHTGGPPPDLAHESIARDDAGNWRWCAPTPGDPWPGECVR